MQRSKRLLSLRMWRTTLAMLATVITATAFMPSVSKAELGGVLYVHYNGWDMPDVMAHHYTNYYGDADDGASSIVHSNITSQPVAKWFGDWAGSGGSDAKKYVSTAVSKGQIPVLVLYNIVGRDCKGLSGGGAPDYQTYEAWINEIANGIGQGLMSASKEDVQVVVLLEPDSLGLMPNFNSSGQRDDAPYGGAQCWNSDGTPMFNQADRFTYLKHAVTALSAAGGNGCKLQSPTGSSYRPASCPSYYSRVRVYLDGGHSGWQGWWPGEMARRLIAGGISQAVGFFTNASNYRIVGNVSAPVNAPDFGELSYGKMLLDNMFYQLNLANGGHGWGLTSCFNSIGGPCGVPEKRQIIDVSRNGATDAKGVPVNLSLDPQPGTGWPAYCDNAAARLGQTPTTHPFGVVGQVYVDALLWIKPVGQSDGCWGAGNSAHPGDNPPPSAKRSPVDPNKSISEAGTPTHEEACSLLRNSWDARYVPGGVDGSGNLITSVIMHDCSISMMPNGPGYVETKDATISTPLPPKGLRITEINAANNTVMLEWQPSWGACGYQIGSNTTGSKTSFLALRTGQSAMVASDENGPGMGPFTRFVVNPAVRGSKVTYGVRARNCAPLSTYPEYIKDFPNYSPWVTTDTISFP